MRLHIYVNGLERDIPEHLTDINPHDTAHLMQIIRQTISFLKLNAKVEKIMTKIQSSFFWSSTEPIDLNTNNTVNISDIKDDIYVYLNTSYGGTRRKRRRRRTRR